MIYTPTSVPVLDHGFVVLCNLAGPTRRRDQQFDASDVDPANAARMSFEQMDSDRTYEDEMRLNRYLMKNHHDTPFESIVVWLRYKLPIFVARQLVRHRTQSLNEVSGRYVQLPAEWYIPALDQVRLQTANKKQGGNLVDLSDPEQHAKAVRARARLDVDCHASYRSYLDAIEDGIAMEQARCHLHLNHYTHWLSTMNLRNLFHMLWLRDDSHAQGEAVAYAKAATALLDPHIPGLMATYREFKRGEA